MAHSVSTKVTPENSIMKLSVVKGLT